MKQFYTYLHCKPNGDPFYVGKGCGVRSHDFHGRNQHHKRIVAKHGKENIEVLVFSRESEQASFDDEIKWIQVLREAGHELANLCDGGEGSSGALRSPETRAKMSKAQKGKSRSAESCKKQSVRMTGKKRSIDFINKISAIQKGNKRALGHKQTQEHRDKLAISKLGNKNHFFGKKHSLDALQKISESSKARRASVETRKKMSDARKKHWEKFREERI